MLARVLLIDYWIRDGASGRGVRREHSTGRCCVTVVLRDSVHCVHSSTAPRLHGSTVHNVRNVHNVHSTPKEISHTVGTSSLNLFITS
jgi:hypothetical protein